MSKFSGVVVIGLASFCAILFSRQAQSVLQPCKVCKCKQYDIIRTGVGVGVARASLGDAPQNVFGIVQHAWKPAGRRLAATCHTGPDVPQMNQYFVYSWPNADDGCILGNIVAADYLENTDPGTVAPIKTGDKKLQVLCTTLDDEILVEEPFPVPGGD